MVAGLRWFEDDSFWRDMAPKIYTPEQWHSAAAEVQAALALLSIQTPAAILDMCCGVGRHSVELAKLGHTVTGVDLNAEYLEIAESAALKAGVSVHFVRSDMRHYRAESSYDTALLLWNAFGYFENDEEDVRALRCLHGSLRSGGKLLIQTHGKESTARRFIRKDWFEIDDSLVLDQRWIDDNWSVMRTRYIIIDKGCRREHVMSCRLYSPSDLTRLLELSGFNVIKVYGGLSGADYDEKAFELVVTAVT